MSGTAARRGGSTSSERILLEDPRIEIDVRRSRGARRLSLTVSHVGGRARVTAPPRCGRAVIERFARDHRAWLRNAIARAPTMVTLGPGVDAPFRGERLRILGSGAARGLRHDPATRTLHVGGPEAEVGRRALLWLKEQARAELLARSQARADALGVTFRKVTIRDTRSRWGSCTHDGALSFSWRLILAPPAVLDYVAAHEVAHIVELNHSPRFWEVVARLRPDWREKRDWLRRRGAELHRYQA